MAENTNASGSSESAGSLNGTGGVNLSVGQADTSNATSGAASAQSLPQNAVIPMTAFGALMESISRLTAATERLNVQANTEVSSSVATGNVQLQQNQPNQQPPTTAGQVLHHKLYDLPQFSGKLEEWPLFYANYMQTTSTYAYNDVQNLFRLQKCLVGDAKEAVASMLIYPNNVTNIIEELKMRFGRSELLARDQLLKLQNLPTITFGKMDQIVGFASKVRNVVALLSSTECEHHLSNVCMIEQVVGKLPMGQKLEWAKHSTNIQPHATLKDLSEWLNELAKVVSTIPPGLAEKKTDKEKAEKPKPKHVFHVDREPAAANFKCHRCQGAHRLAECGEFEQLDNNSKWEYVKQLKLCFECLGKNHSAAKCRSKKKCSVESCNHKFHPILHNHQLAAASENSAVSLMNCQVTSANSGIFKIIPVLLSGPKSQVQGYAMIDEGSAITLIEENVSKQLGLIGKTYSLKLKWFGERITQEPSTIVQLKIQGVKERSVFVLKNVRTIKHLNLPTQSFEKDDYDYLADIDMPNYINAKPVILLGLDNAMIGAPHETVYRGEQEPVAIRTMLGWLAYGPSKEKSNWPAVMHISEMAEMDKLHQTVAEYFSTENFGTNSLMSLPESADDKKARNVMQKTTIRREGRYETGLLWKQYPPVFPDSIEMARNRLAGIERKMRTDDVFRENYTREMNNYFVKGYARVLEENELNTDLPVWYLPHFVARNIHKPDKFRIVFDAASAIDGVSLNSSLLKGPEQVKPLLEILFKFRKGHVGVSADIREMFSQVKIRESDQHSQRFLWKFDGKVSQHCVMTSMIFGATCSPCCAEFVKNVNAEIFEQEFPDAVKIVKEQHYVDDMVCSFSSEEEAIKTCTEVKAIQNHAGFELRKFISNKETVEHELNDLKAQHIAHVDMGMSERTEKVLGMVWNTCDDVFEFRTKFYRIPEPVREGNRRPTKRQLLSVVMAVFDPFGILADFMLYAKVLVNETWKLNIGWDDEVPDAIFKKWQHWVTEFKNVYTIKVQRCYSLMLAYVREAEIHVFVDASQVAFAAVAYLRIKSEVSFVAGKTRTTSAKLLSIPRLELQAAVLGVRLSQMVVSAHDMRITRVTFWTDSRTVLFWVKSTKRKYKAFVGHRMAEILSVSSPDQWRWVPTGLNPADAATRVKKRPKIQQTGVWLQGPEFLKMDESSWPKTEVNTLDDCGDEDEVACYHMQMQASINVFEFNRFSSYLKLKRVCALVLRACGAFKREAKVAKSPRVISVVELESAERLVCSIVQQESFPEELSALRASQRLLKSSSIYKLQPYLDSNGILRLQSRLDEALYLPMSARRPILLPRRHEVVTLIIRYYHERYHHQNSGVIMSEIRQKFWIPRLKSALKEVQRACKKCQLLIAAPQPPIMGMLPPDRVTPYVRPFTYAGVDLFGPINVTIGRSRQKRWAVLFTCLTVRATHLELAEDLSTDAFIICLRNFVNRRGTPIRIRCDCGTNFVGAQRQLKEDQYLLDFERIENEASNRNIEFVFNCPGNPSSGGCWERLVRIAKRLLYDTLKEVAPKVETLRSVLIEVENILNSRPLTDVPLEAYEDEPITPNHFLIGCPNSTQTPQEEQPIGKILCLRKQWRIAQMLKDRLWKRWVNEYLPQLINRSKWNDKPTPIKIDDVVLICDPSQPRSSWQKGMVTNVFPAKDGQIRIVEVRTSSGTLRRPVNRLAILDVRKSD